MTSRMLNATTGPFFARIIGKQKVRIAFIIYRMMFANPIPLAKNDQIPSISHTFQISWEVLYKADIIQTSRTKAKTNEEN